MTLEEKAKNLKVEDFLELLRIAKVYKQQVPGYLLTRDGTDIIIINPGNDMNDYYNQPIVVIPANDYLAQLATMQIPSKKKFRKQGRKENEI